MKRYNFHHFQNFFCPYFYAQCRWQQGKAPLQTFISKKSNQFDLKLGELLNLIL